MTSMAAKLTRRKLALAAVPLLSSSAPAQTPPVEDDLTIQRQNLQRWRDQMSKVKLPIATEPAFVFKA